MLLFIEQYQNILEKLCVIKGTQSETLRLIRHIKMKQEIITNKITTDLKNEIKNLGELADLIEIAVAFFSDNEIIKDWAENNKKINIIVSLRPPTNYYSLKAIQTNPNIDCRFLDDKFHSKIYLFYKNENLFAAIIGSSNFTTGGLSKNIETNIIITDSKLLQQIKNQFESILELSHLLQPSDLAKYKINYDNFKNREKQNNEEHSDFQSHILKNRKRRKKNQKINKEAKRYFAFWKIVDEVKDNVADISVKEFPDIPVYLTIDHFWHWIKIVWAKEGHPTPNKTNRSEIVSNLFKKYCDWDKKGDNHTKLMWKTSQQIFANYLSESNIDRLTKEQAKELYKHFHFGPNRIQRFKADEKFINNNEIENIRTFFKYLLYSNDDLDIKINSLTQTKPIYKLAEISKSAIQEVLGWVRPEIYPLRNDKADDAIKILGYDIDEYVK